MPRPTVRRLDRSTSLVADRIQIDPEEIIAQMRGNQAHRRIRSQSFNSTTPYTTRYSSREEISKYKIPIEGVSAAAVRQLLKDELDLDGRPNLNLARYVSR